MRCFYCLSVVRRQHFNCNRYNEENLLDFCTVERFSIHARTMQRRKTASWKKVDGLRHLQFCCIWFVARLWSFVPSKKDDDDDEIDSFCGLGSAIIKAIFSAFVNASFRHSLSHWCETGNGWKCGKSSTKTVFGATSERGKNKHLTMARRIPLYETKANREWGAFCWNYTLNYAMHSGSETAMWAA